MMWIGLLVGIVLGYAGAGGTGAVTLGFLGWLAGLIAASLRAEPYSQKYGSQMEP